MPNTPPPLLKTTAGFSLVVGIMNLAMWTFLLVSGQVTGVEEELISFLFHWLSEFLTALLLITAGILILKDRPSSRKFLYLALGFLFNAAQGAFWYYVRNPDIILQIVMALITAATIFYAIANYALRQDLLYAALGISIYAAINITGNALQDGNMNLVVYTVPALVVLSILTILLLRRRSPQLS